MNCLNMCFINELAKLKESSKEAVDNLDSFNEFKKYMHVKRQIEEEFVDLITKAKNSPKPQLILVCGGVGDGKSHLLSYIRSEHSQILENFQFHNDATESFEPQKTSIDTLNDILNDYADENLNGNSVTKIILAINLGTLNNFTDSSYGSRYTLLKEYVNENKILESEIVENVYNPNSYFHFINFSDYHMYTLTDNGADSSYIMSIMDKVVSESENNPFYRSYLENCKHCICNSKCPIKHNYEFLQNKQVRVKITSILISAMVKYKLIISTRALLNFLYDILVSNYFDTANKITLIKYINDIDFIKYLECITPNLLYEHSDRSSILEMLVRLDPINSRNEILDNLIINLNNTESLVDVFEKYVDIENFDMLMEVLLYEEKLNELASTEKERRYLKDKLIRLFIRLYDFKPKEYLIELEDQVYTEYLKNLYYWNVGNKSAIKKLYSDIKEAIYKWNGESFEENWINIFIGKNQLKYKISMKLEIQPYLSDLKENNRQDIHKFIPYLKLKFREKNSEEVISISVDYLMYNLLIKIIKGYRPNKKDKNNFISFTEFIEQLTSQGSYNTGLIFEEKVEGTARRFKLKYNDFDEYSFMEN